jgi:hypothetical protein
MMKRATNVAILAVLLVSCASRAQAQVSSKARIEAFAKLPDWSGLWEPMTFVGEGIGQDLSPEGLRAGAALSSVRIPFNAEWQVKFDAGQKARAAAIAADPAHPPAPPYNNCGSPPYIFNRMTSPAVFQWRITPEETTIVDTINGIRHLYTDGRSHPPKDELWPTSMGDSVGRWEGDTLVVDTVAVKPEILPNGFPLEMSEQLHFVERMRMVSHDELQDEVTMEDPVALTEPYKVTLSYARVTDTNRMIDETECNSTSDRNPIVNGRFTAITSQ